MTSINQHFLLNDGDLSLDDLEELSPFGGLESLRPLRQWGRTTRPRVRNLSKAPDWASVCGIVERQASPAQAASPQELVYIVDLPESVRDRGLAVEVAGPTRPKALRAAEKKRRPISRWTPIPVTQALIDAQTDPADIAALTALLGATSGPRPSYDYYRAVDSARFWLTRAARDLIPPILARTGRLRLRRVPEELDPALLLWDDSEPWQLRLKASIATTQADADEWEIGGVLRRGEAEVPLERAEVLFEGGLMLLDGALRRFDDSGAFPWVVVLMRHKNVRVPADQQRAFLEQIYATPTLPPLELPEGRALLEVAPVPVPRLRVFPPAPDQNRGRGLIRAAIELDYDRFSVPAEQPGQLAFDAERRRLVRRDPAAEAAAKDKLAELGWTPLPPGPPVFAGDDRHRVDVQIPIKRFPSAVHALVTSGFTVEAEGKLYRRPGEFRIELTSGIDWFDLHATCDFEGVPANLPALLEALRRGEKTIVLDDGSLGILPEEWLSRYGALAKLGSTEEGQIRFRRSQVGLLDALLAAQPEVSVDAVFQKARTELRRFQAITPELEPRGFQGELRGYQRVGLGWLLFLHRFGFGGCLADEMGLGKTVQVLALLAALKAQEPGRLPSLVVAPRSLIFNWKSEAARFTPELRLLDHTGATRLSPGEHFENFDMVLTTYGTLRRDAAELSQVTFDYVILDEAQAIKNDRSQAAKAARLLQADHRLALSGTPIENHLGELWSLFEFLNPGMLGRASVFKEITGAGRDLGGEARVILGRALRPFILRRTKREVAPELPDRLEETRLLDLERAERARYDELRRYYRASLRRRVAEQGIEKSKIHVLEALLRLRQAALHPGLLDPKRRDEGSAKLETLVAELANLRENGQKALVFSQFTSLLAIVRERLDKERIVYEYLDGQTHDRAARVERFQTDPGCPVFLISLKAGGLGLNLTAAEYVFLLDPWWNPAVEAQAIDRAHRIGQTRAVFAYRLIARDTIEERIVELSQRKRELAESVIAGDESSPLRDLTAEDLELLLS